jgi:hypothetical protein
MKSPSVTTVDNVISEAGFAAETITVLYLSKTLIRKQFWERARKELATGRKKAENRRQGTRWKTHPP